MGLGSVPAEAKNCTNLQLNFESVVSDGTADVVDVVYVNM